MSNRAFYNDNRNVLPSIFLMVLLGSAAEVSATPTVSFNYNIAYPTTAPHGAAWLQSVNGINNSGTVVGQITDAYNYYGFVGNNLVAYPGSNTSYTVGVAAINNLNAILGNQYVNAQNSPLTNEFYSTSANYTTAMPTGFIDGTSFSNPSFAGITDSGIVIGTANPAVGEGYTYLFSYDTANQTLTKTDLPFVDSSIIGSSVYTKTYCSLAPADLVVQATAVSSDGTWVAGNYSYNKENTFGLFTYNTMTKKFKQFYKSTANPNLSQNWVTGININGVLVGWQSFYAAVGPANKQYTGSGFVYDANKGMTLVANVVEPKSGNMGSTAIQGINDKGVMVGNSQAPDQPCPGEPNATCGGQNYFFTATYK